MSNYCNAPLKVLLIEDNAADADLVCEYLDISELDYEVTLAKRLSEALALIAERSYDLILLDLSLPDSNGIATLSAVSEPLKDAVIIILTGADDEQLSLTALKAGAQDYLDKDTLSSDILKRSIRYALERSYLLRRVEANAQEVQDRESLLRCIFDSNTDAMLILSPKYEIKFLNPAAGDLLDSSPESLVGEVFPFEVSPGGHTELEIPGPEDSTRLVEVVVVNLIWQGKSALLVVLRDVTQRHEAETALESEKERLSMTLDSISDAVIAIDAHGHIELLNQEATKLTGYNNKDASDKPLGEVLQLMHPKTGKIISDPLNLLLSSEKAEITPELGIQLHREKLEPILVTIDIRCIMNDEQKHSGCVVVIRDISALKQTEEELFQAEKLSSISLLAGGIAHDFNNILAAILGNISVVRMSLDESDENSQKLSAAENATLQAKSLTQQLLTFSKGGSPVLESTTIHQFVEDCTQFILRGSNVKCEIEAARDLWPVDADKGQIGQVVNNLLINADQAMPNGGIISLKLKNNIIRKSQIPTLESGEYVSIEISDKGCGITPENLKRIFDPYFTTKKDGNGLGLASSYSIIKSHKGILTVDSEVEKGSTFTIHLPRSKQKPRTDATETAKAEGDTKSSLHMGQGRILVMDDMEAMMMVAGEIIGMLGYEVSYSTNGEEAIKAYKAAKDAGTPFDAVVFDLTVPGGMGGEEAAYLLMEYDPDLIAIASSGYTTSNVMSDFEHSPFKAVVPKPYRIKEMSDALQRVIESQAD